MSITTKKSVSEVLVGAVLFLLTACQSEELIPNVENFAIYNLPIKAVQPLPKGYALLSDSVWFTVSPSGNPSDLIDINVFDAMYYSSELLFSDDKVYVLMSLYSEAGEFIDLGIVEYNLEGELLRKERIGIADEFDGSDLPKINSNYTLRFPLYAKGILLPSDEMVIAFNYIGRLNERWKVALLHLSNDLTIINRVDFQGRDFYGWVYDLAPVNDSEFMMTRGGNDWFSIDQFGLDFQLDSYFKDLGTRDAVGNPILTNIIPVSDGKFILTGHADRRNNPDNSVNTNFDYWVVSYDKSTGIETERFIGSNINKELCFDSYVTQDNKLVLAGGYRGLNQTSLDLSARVKIVETTLPSDQNESAPEEYLLTEVGGMEAMFIYENPAGSQDIIGRKFGFNEANVQSFFRTIKVFNHE